LNINIYYGGRGIIDDPTIYVINKIQEVLEELRVKVMRYNLYEVKNTIATLPQTLKDADGIILATTVEWYGIGGYMQQFLDSCWLFGDKEKICDIYMAPIVMSTTYGEREAKHILETAWEILGGRPCSGMCGYVENTVMLEMNEDYANIIAKKAENIYRTINQHVVSFPASNQTVKQRVALPQASNLTPQETEQLSRYVSDDTYVQRQKEDIQELTSLFRDKLTKGSRSTEEYISELKNVYKPQAGFEAVYSINIEGRNDSLIVTVKNTELECRYGTVSGADVEMQLGREAMDDIVAGKMTFQRAFMSGSIKMKGDFKVLRTMDQLFPFGN
jgi:multimeric flavodoxin WrbA/putative sterol carrier protein